MSCFVMTPDAIRRIAHTLADILNASRNGCNCTVDTTAAAVANLHKKFFQYYSPIRGYNAEGIAEDLYRLNCRSYNTRYNITFPDLDILPLRERDDYSIRHFFDVPDMRPRPWHYHLAKAIDCYLYQTDEDATRADPLRAVLESFNAALMAEIVRNTGVYNNYGWGE